MTRQIPLDGRAAGQRIDVFLAAELQISRAQARRLLERGEVALAGRVLTLRDKGRPLPAEGRLEIARFRAPDDQHIAAARVLEAAPRVVAKGAGWLAVDKPAGMPVHPFREDETETVLGHLIADWPGLQGVGEGGLRSGVVHRLDVETSGVMLVATEQASWERLRAAFAEHRVSKRYRAIVAGAFEPSEGEVEMVFDLVVARHRPARVRVASQAERTAGRARRVEQQVRRLARLRGASLVEVRPRTGFLHQIRATLAHLGHPVLGDRRYGGDEVEAARSAGASRTLLHAAEVGYREISGEAPDPADFAAALRALCD